MSSTIYQCVRCGRTATKEEWERGEPKLEAWERQERDKRMMGVAGGVFKCPFCSFKVSRKVRSPIVKRIKAV